MRYIDGFVIAVPRDRLDEYRAMATLGATVWMEHGALSYVETIADDVPMGTVTSFPRAVQATADETVTFSWITYASRAERDRINALVMADVRLKDGMNNPPFDAKRMIWGGFETLLER